MSSRLSRGYRETVKVPELFELLKVPDSVLLRLETVP
jgi:hypothetical protein